MSIHHQAISPMARKAPILPGKPFWEVVFVCFFLQLLLGPILVLAKDAVQPDTNGEVASNPAFLPMKEAIQNALKFNPDLEASHARLSASFSRVDQAKASLLPGLSNSLQYSERISAGSTLGFNPGRGSIKSILYQDNLSLQIPIYTGGRGQLQLRRAKTAVKKSEEDLATTRSEVISLAIETYLNLLKAIELKKSSEEREASIAAQRENAKQRIEAELDTKSDFLKAEVQLESAKESVLIAKSAVETSKNTLNLVMGMEMENLVDPVDIASFPEVTDSIETLCRLAEANNFNLNSTRRQVEILKQSLHIEKAGHLPTLSFTGSYGKSHRDFPPKDKNWSVGGSLDFKIFDGGLQSAKISEAHKRLEEGEALMRKTRQAVQAQVRNAFLHYQTARERVEVSGKALELATEELRLSRLQVKEGLITMADHLDNQADYTKAQVSFIVARFDRYLSTLALFKLSGRLTYSFLDAL